MIPDSISTIQTGEPIMKKLIAIAIALIIAPVHGHTQEGPSMKETVQFIDAHLEGCTLGFKPGDRDMEWRYRDVYSKGKSELHIGSYAYNYISNELVHDGTLVLDLPDLEADVEIDAGWSKYGGNCSGSLKLRTVS